MRNLVPTNATPGLPLDFHDLRQGDAVLLGAADWHVRIDAGHSPAPASFFSADRATMITGDQIMPHVYPFVGQQPGQAPSASPLLRYFDYLKSLDQYEDEVLALPGHGDPFYGIAARAAKIALHHSRRTDRLLEALRTPTSLVDLIPALINRPLEPIFLMIGLIEASAQVEMLLQRELLERWTEPSGVALHRLR